MLMLVEPHDLKAIAEECNTTIEAVSQETGILEEELLAFAKGHLALSAKARLDILMALSKNASQNAQNTSAITLPRAVQTLLIMGVGTTLITIDSCRRLLDELDDELREDALRIVH